jgi:sugar/nucleoside kinase (ribokinase family)
LRIVVVSDCILDVYFVLSDVRVKRITVARSAVFSPGGACTTAIAAQRAGAEALIVDDAGSDEAGFILKTMLSRLGLKIEGMAERKDLSTPVCANLLFKDGTHSFVGSMPNRISGLIERIEGLGRYEALFFNGYALLANPELPEIADRQREKGVRVFFDPGPLRLEEKLRERMCGVSDFIIPNESESRSWTSCRKAALVIKLGRRGARVIADGRIRWIRPFRADIVVTDVGAGDTFDGAFMAEYLRSGDAVRAAAFASAAASLKLRGIGAGSIPDRQEVEGLLGDG